MSRPRTRLAVLGLVCVILLVTIGTIGVGRLCSSPVDVSGTTDLPDWVRAVKERDEIAYPAHALLAEALTGLGCSPEAIALQWVKAGAHARTPEDVAAVREGLRRLAAAAGSAARIADDLCPRLRGRYASRAQQAAIEAAGITCDDVAAPLPTPTGRSG